MPEKHTPGPDRPGPLIPLETSNVAESAELACAERLFQIGYLAVSRLSGHKDVEPHLLLFAADQSERPWRLCAFNDAIPLAAGDMDSEGAAKAKSWLETEKARRVLNEQWERALQAWHKNRDPVLFSTDDLAMFLIAIPMPRGLSRFLAAVPVRSFLKREMAREVAVAFCRAVYLAESFVGEHISSFIDQEGLSRAWSSLLAQLGELTTSLRDVAAQIGRLFGADICEIWVVYGPAGTLKEPVSEKLFGYRSGDQRPPVGPVAEDDMDGLPEREARPVLVLAEAKDDIGHSEDSIPVISREEHSEVGIPGFLRKFLKEVQRDEVEGGRQRLFRILNDKQEVATHPWFDQDNLANLVVMPIPISSSSKSRSKALSRLKTGARFEDGGADGAPARPAIHGLLVLGNMQSMPETGATSSRRVTHLDILRLHQVAGTLAIALEGQRYHEQSLRDPNTGLFNRAHLDRFCQRSFLRKRGYGAVFIDLDDFKRYNTRFGYRGGDRVIEAVSKILREEAEIIGSQYTWIEASVYREGGDEFVLIVSVREPRVETGQWKEPTEKLAYRVQRRAREAPFLRTEMGTRLGLSYMAPAGISLSVGVAPARTSNPQDWTNLMFRLSSVGHGEAWRRPIRQASCASQVAKSAGGNAIVLWDQLGRFVTDGTPIMAVYENSKVLIKGGFKDGLREGFVFETFHSLGQFQEEDFARPCAEMEIIQTYSRVSVCELVFLERKLIGAQEYDPDQREDGWESDDGEQNGDGGEGEKVAAQGGFDDSRADLAWLKVR